MTDEHGATEKKHAEKFGPTSFETDAAACCKLFIQTDIKVRTEETFRLENIRSRIAAMRTFTMQGMDRNKTLIIYIWSGQAEKQFLEDCHAHLPECQQIKQNISVEPSLLESGKKTVFGCNDSESEPDRFNNLVFFRLQFEAWRRKFFSSRW